MEKGREKMWTKPYGKFPLGLGDEMGRDLYCTHIYVFLACALLAGCGTTDLSGVPNSSDGTVAEDPAIEDSNTEDTAEPEPACWDRDGDGYPDVSCGGTDCDDSDPNVHPDAPEICGDGVDQDCRPGVPPSMRREEPLLVDGIAAPGAWTRQTWTGSEFGLIWSRIERIGDAWEQGTFLSIIEPAGMEIREEVLTSTADRLPDVLPDVHWTGSGYGLFWLQGSGDGVALVYTLLDANGVVEREPRDVLVVQHVSEYSTVWTGSGYGIAWRGMRDDAMGLYLSTVDDSGHMSGESFCGEYYSRPSTAWTGSVINVAFERGERELGFISARATGEIMMNRVLYSCSEGSSAFCPTLEWTGSELGVAFSLKEWSTGEGDVYFVKATADGDLASEIVQATTIEGWTTGSDLEWTGGLFGLSWTERRSVSLADHYDGYFVILNSEGRPIVEALHVSETPGWEPRPTLAWTGSEFGVTWQSVVPGMGRHVFFNTISYCE
jgi:predicted 3-demethylubiquinone-9 3-methyltransferase (glyoxalase superfamily)